VQRFDTRAPKSRGEIIIPWMGQLHWWRWILLRSQDILGE